MARLAIHDPGVDSAAVVVARALAAHRKRVAQYERSVAYEPPAKPVSLVEPLPAPIVVKFPPVPWECIRDEVARQAGVERWTLSKDGGRKLSIVALRQLAVALTRRLAGLSLPAIAHRYGLRNHSTALHGVSGMREIMAALERELTEDEPVSHWVERALPLVAEHVSEIRQRYRMKQAQPRESTREANLRLS